MNETRPISGSGVAATPEIVAVETSHDIQLNASSPAGVWEKANPITFCADWQGKSPDPARETEVRVLWTNRTLYLRFACHYVELHTFADSDPNGRRDHLWDRDVAEVFLQPDPSRERYYKEFEIAPNGMWIDLDVSPGPLQDLKSGMKSSVWVDSAQDVWFAEAAIPFKSLTASFDPQHVWRVNFYRVEGVREPRSYLAWQPTHSPQPNFHVPSAFGRLRFATQKR